MTLAAVAGLAPSAHAIAFDAASHPASELATCSGRYAIALAPVAAGQPAAAARIAPLADSKLSQLRARQEGAGNAVSATRDAGRLAGPVAGVLGRRSPLDFHCAGTVASPLSRFAMVTGFAGASKLAPSIPRIDPVPTDRPSVFGAVAVAIGRTPLDRRWQAVEASRFDPQRGPWSAIVREGALQSRLGALELVNRWVNARVAFTADVGGPRDRKADRWQTAEETLRRGRGDCEDYAIAKRALLRAMGVADKDMFLVLVRDKVVRDDHMILAVRAEDGFVALDNRSDRLLDAGLTQDYRPIMSFSGERRWLYGDVVTDGGAHSDPHAVIALSALPN